MPEQDAAIRVRNFQEVPLGYAPDQARLEAERCLGCKKPFCVEGCPVQVDIPGFIRSVAEGNYIAAARTIKKTNCLPAICGRVCPQESQCEIKCILGKKSQPVAIGRLERFAADYEREHDHAELPDKMPATGKRVAVVGAGPAGLTVAGDLVLLGHEVTIFEAFHLPGGVLTYGIPEFRLPKKIVQAEIDYLRRLGVRFELNQVIGQTIAIDELFAEEGYHAVFVGVGAGLPYLMGIPGENLGGVYLANEYLTRVNLMKAYDFPAVDTPVVRGARFALSAEATWPWTRPGLRGVWMPSRSRCSIAVPARKCRPGPRKFITPRRKAFNSACFARPWLTLATKKAWSNKCNVRKWN